MKSRNFIYFRPKKYNNVTCTVDGMTFDSRREKDYYGQLKMEKRAKLIKDFDRQVTFDLFAWTPNGRKLLRHYLRVDFLVTLQNGEKEIREVKSKVTMTPEWATKQEIFQANYPEISYKVIL